MDHFLESYHFRMNENLRMVTRAFSFLDEADLWKQPNASLPSMGNLIVHLCGNITQYGIASLGDTKDTRDRPSEFTTQKHTKSQLLERLHTTVAKALEVASLATREQWNKERVVQGFTLTGVGVALHVVEHFSYHTGQIAFYTKLIKDKDLGFYNTTNLNTLNE